MLIKHFSQLLNNPNFLTTSARPLLAIANKFSVNPQTSKLHFNSMGRFISSYEKGRRTISISERGKRYIHSSEKIPFIPHAFSAAEVEKKLNHSGPNKLQIKTAYAPFGIAVAIVDHSTYQATISGERLRDLYYKAANDMWVLSHQVKDKNSSDSVSSIIGYHNYALNNSRAPIYLGTEYDSTQTDMEVESKNRLQ
jgi:hypothetical protein